MNLKFIGKEFPSLMTRKRNKFFLKWSVLIYFSRRIYFLILVAKDKSCRLSKETLS